ncbi:uncharacterized protein YALI1_D11971g [Yarrowia lipolytica]|uniref:Uncharacterized protein n=1 Tax=Yarrowia lipolytica TaxID=4952 RepID=A0A1D8NDV0_YARLL|nr:hypothetical protein YALI1_D11971g [Yarrowia lipolytica]
MDGTCSFPFLDLVSVQRLPGVGYEMVLVQRRRARLLLFGRSLAPACSPTDAPNSKVRNLPAPLHRHFFYPRLSGEASAAGSRSGTHHVAALHPRVTKVVVLAVSRVAKRFAMGSPKGFWWFVGR